MTRQQVRARIEEIGIIPAIRVSSPEDALFAAEAVSAGGIPIVEVTMTVPGAIEVIRSLVANRPGVIVGAGTVWNTGTAKQCMDAGANFLTITGFDPHIVEVANAASVVVIPGALTPTEVMMAWKAGSDFVKIFPCAQMGGPSYIKTLKSPYPQIPMIASGGVNEQNLAEYIEAGVSAAGIGAHLIPRKAIELRQASRIHQLAARCLRIVKEVRTPSTNGQ